MTFAQITLVAVLFVTLSLQALLPARRLLIVTAGAGLSAALTPLLTGCSSRALLAGVPWDVILIVLALGLLSELLAGSRVFHLLAVAATRRSGGDGAKVALMFTAGMYVISGLVNNLTALLLVLPVLLSLLKLLGATQRSLRWTVGPMLVACNLGGAATPIGDFPAILLLGRGAMGFSAYLARALPQTAAVMVLLLLIVGLVVRPAADSPSSPLSARLALRTMGALHRNIRLDRRRFLPGAVALLAMLLAWTFTPPAWGLGVEVIAWVGAAAALLAAPGAAERLLRRRLDAETALFLFCLFILVGAVRESGALQTAAEALLQLPIDPRGQLLVFLVAAAGLTGAFSAGPSMAALLDVAEALTASLPGPVVYVGLAMSVCAGSSLFLTAATSGPLAQGLTERAALRDADGVPIRFDFMDFVPVGALGFALTLGVGLAFAWIGAGG